MPTTMRRTGRLTAALAATAVLGLGLSGCFAEPSGGTGTDRISVAHMQPPRSGLSPMSDDAFKLSRWSTAETLVVLDDLGDPQPGLATEWTRTDDRTWTFTIRPGVTFHDGEELTAEAAAASIQTAIDSTPVPRILDGVKLTVEAKGDTVEMTTAEPDPLLPNRLSSPQLSILSPNAYAGGTVDPVGTGTGPFELTKVDGTTSATLDRFEGYWGEKARAAGIDVDFVPDGTARAAALRTGEADIVEAIPAGQASSIDEKLLTEVPMPRTNTLYLNNEKGPFTDPAVRAAAREAIDRAEIIATAYEGRADEAAGFLGPALPWAAELRNSQEYKDIVSRRAQPAQVDGVKITLGTFTDRAELPEVAVLLEQQLEAAGFVVEQDVREYQYIEGDALEGKFDSFMLSRATILDSGDPVAYFASDFTCEGGFNLPQLCDTGIDDAIAAAAQAEQGDERRRLTMDAEATILAGDAAIPLLHERVIQGETEGVEDAVRDPRERLLVTGATHVAP
ncbi:peptide/nickel transport system substrate-binding protein [Brevibacterium sanguinis]|uniref:Peptide/nickel transport system substrate-binding protein n=2 Tax=Brevibacterium TaxID=1696 RepID=A0A366IMM5_9MICO|nr:MULTISPECIES: ABC transporter substrate-binding protein [Brevibacterium]RBP61685.1 peptide/nickel transport system substrate-binding protein [Brevibacterium sanguinis]RBP74334.1 peptide/nickel transport system substrate-binding protein [Brevibacterium celere]